MTDIHIPPEALEAGARKIHEHGQHAHIAWRDLSDFDRECLRDVSHDCFLAMIEAWPGMWVLHQTDEDYIPPRHDLILPLPQ